MSGRFKKRRDGVPEGRHVLHEQRCGHAVAVLPATAVNQQNGRSFVETLSPGDDVPVRPVPDNCLLIPMKFAPQADHVEARRRLGLCTPH